MSQTRALCVLVLLATGCGGDAQGPVSDTSSDVTPPLDVPIAPPDAEEDTAATPDAEEDIAAPPDAEEDGQTTDTGAAPSEDAGPGVDVSDAQASEDTGTPSDDGWSWPDADGPGSDVVEDVQPGVDVGPADTVGLPDAEADGGGTADTVEPVAAMAMSGPDMMAMGACGAFTLTPIEGASWASVEVALNLSGGGGLYAAPDCTDSVESVTLTAEAATTFYVQAPMSPGPLVATASAAGATPADWEAVVSDAELFHADDYVPHALVIYNENFPGAESIADHYVKARGLDAAQRCAVQLPTGQFGTPSDILGVRRTILSDCLCPLIAEDERPDPCDWTVHAEIMALTVITHLVLIKGLPARLYATEWSASSEEPSFAHYLSHMLANDDALFTSSTTGSTSGNYVKSTAFDYPPDLTPAVDKRFAYGTVEAMTVARTKGLIDRTLAAEAAGLQGNVLTERERRQQLRLRPGRLR